MAPCSYSNLSLWQLRVPKLTWNDVIYTIFKAKSPLSAKSISPHPDWRGCTSSTTHWGCKQCLANQYGLFFGLLFNALKRSHQLPQLFKTLFCCKAPQMFCGLQMFTRLSICVWRYPLHISMLKEQFVPQSKIHIFIYITYFYLDCFGVRGRILRISAVQISDFSLNRMDLDDIRIGGLKIIHQFLHNAPIMFKSKSKQESMHARWIISTTAEKVCIFDFWMKLILYSCHCKRVINIQLREPLLLSTSSQTNSLCRLLVSFLPIFVFQQESLLFPELLVWSFGCCCVMQTNHVQGKMSKRSELWWLHWETRLEGSS